ncbi:MAG: signal peptidase I [Firmicutes bacterium]|nr:signal peptidase I [Bacillota bacterium]MBR6682860.1 signal peptidase I [Bacillota bacterium]
MSDKDLSKVIRDSLEGQEKEKKKSAIRELISWALVIVMSIGVALFLNGFVIVNARVTSGSMENTIMTGDRVLGLRFSYWFSEPQQGDIVIFKYPDDESQNYIKRIIGLPGDKVEIIEGLVYVNGELLNEPYLWEMPKGSFGPYVVPEKHYFMLGDNRNNSRDSRYWNNKFVSDEQILGKAYWIYYPELKSVNH